MLSDRNCLLHRHEPHWRESPRPWIQINTDYINTGNDVLCWKKLERKGFGLISLLLQHASHQEIQPLLALWTPEKLCIHIRPGSQKELKKETKIIAILEKLTIKFRLKIAAWRDSIESVADNWFNNKLTFTAWKWYLEASLPNAVKRNASSACTLFPLDKSSLVRKRKKTSKNFTCSQNVAHAEIHWYEKLRLALCQEKYSNKLTFRITKLSFHAAPIKAVIPVLPAVSMLAPAARRTFTYRRKHTFQKYSQETYQVE